jgi:4-hydroxy-3-polyprenylbenzoate decarboxylase
LPLPETVSEITFAGVFSGVRPRLDYLDFASPQAGLAGKLGIDATTKIGTEASRDWGTIMQTDPKDAEFAAAYLAQAMAGGA